jgi:hypothetical protein
MRLGLVLPDESAQKTIGMRFVRRVQHDTKTSVIRREGVSSLPEAVPMSSSWSSSVPLARRHTQREVESAVVSTTTPELASAEAARETYDAVEDSDVFLSDKSRSVPAAIREVTLFVHGWENVEPGLLSWNFPSLRAALDAVRRMKNAIGWCVVSGTGWTDLQTARASGAVLVEQLT